MYFQVKNILNLNRYNNFKQGLKLKTNLKW
jgi:hypothetical protein